MRSDATGGPFSAWPVRFGKSCSKEVTMNDVRWWPGLARKVLHRADSDAPRVRVGGLDGRVAICGRVTVPAFGNRLADWPRCASCARKLAEREDT